MARVSRLRLCKQIRHGVWEEFPLVGPDVSDVNVQRADARESISRVSHFDEWRTTNVDAMAHAMAYTMAVKKNRVKSRAPVTTRRRRCDARYSLNARKARMRPVAPLSYL